MRDRIPSSKPCVRCAIYTRKSTEEGLEQEYNSLDAQREAGEAYIASQRHEGWVALSEQYDDGGFTGGNLDRPALKRLLRDIEAGKIDIVVCYKVDRLSRSLLDFAKLIETFDRHEVSFVSVTQSFQTTTSMGRLTLNILLSFAQFERELVSERVRDKVAGAKRKGKYTGGPPVIGYDVDFENHKLVVNPAEAKTVRHIFRRYSELGSGLAVSRELNERGITRKSRTTKKGNFHPGTPWNGKQIYEVMNNCIYIGEVKHRDKVYLGEHEAIVPRALWDKVHSLIAHDPETGRRKLDAAPHLLRGIIRCGHCDNAMTTSWTTRHGKVYSYYVCSRATKMGYSTCPVKTVAAGEMEQAVTNQLRAVFRSPEMIAQTYMQAKAHEAGEIERLRTEKTDLEIKRLRLRDKVTKLVDSGRSDDDARYELRELSRDIEDVERTLADVNSVLQGMQSDAVTEWDVTESLNKIDPLWEELFPIEQHRIVGLLVDKVIVYEDGLDIRIRTDGLHSLITELKGTLSDHQERVCRV